MTGQARAFWAGAALLAFAGQVAPAFAQQTFPVSNAAELQVALSDASGGDTIVLASGYYGDLSISSRDNATAVTVEAGAGQTPQFKHVSVSSSSNWILRGFDVSPRYGASPDSGRAVNLNGSDIVFEDSVVSFGDDVSSWTATDWVQNAGDGIFMWGTRITVRNNALRNVAHGIQSGATYSLVSGNTVVNFCGDGLRGLGDHTVFEYNTIKNCYAVDGNHDDGFQSWSVGPGGVGTGQVVGVVLRGNTIINYEDPGQPLLGTLQGIGMFDGTYVDWVIENNVVIVDHWHGITVAGAVNVRVVNNTVIDPNSTTPGPCWIRVANHKDGTPPSGCIVRNNLAASFASAGTGVTEDHNIVVGDPAAFFVDPGGYDLHLKAGSPAVDAGTSDLAPATDIEGTVRPQGAGYDVGAYEYYTGTPPAPPDAPSGLAATAASSSQVNLSWADNSSNETGFKIERKTGAAGSWGQIATPAVGATSYSDSGLAASTEYFYRVCATNSAGDSAWSNEAGATTLDSSVNAPFHGSPLAIPGRIEAEDYDLGGEGIAWHDTTPGNSGGEYRSDSVDVDTCSDAGGGYYVGWTAAGEWLEYTVDVTAGTSDVSARVASPNSGKSLRVEIGAASVTFNLPNTGSWTAWQTVTVTGVALAGGEQVMRLVCETDGFDLNWIEFAEAGPPPDSDPVVSFTVPGSGATVTGTVAVNALANDPDAGTSDGDGIQNVVFELRRGGTLVATHTENFVTYDWSLDTTGLADGDYALRATATSTAGAGGTSAAAEITVTVDNGSSGDADTDGDGLPDWWEELHGLDPATDDSDDDPDGDGLSNIEEYQRGTDPQTPDAFDDGTGFSCASGTSRGGSASARALAAAGLCLLALFGRRGGPAMAGCYERARFTALRAPDFSEAAEIGGAQRRKAPPVTIRRLPAAAGAQSSRASVGRRGTR